MSTVTPQDVEWIAELARLTLSAQEKDQYAEQLSVIFDYVETLNEVDTDAVIETSQVTGIEDSTRLDVAEPCDEETRKKLIDQFPAQTGMLLQVKAVFTD